MLVLACLITSNLYLFHLKVLLNPVFNCSKRLLSSSIYKVTASTYNFVSVILNVAFLGLLTSDNAGSASGSASLVDLLVNRQFSGQVKIRFISQLINSISSVFQKLLKCFNGTRTLTSFSVLLPSNLPVTLVF